MTILICGDRNWTDCEKIAQWLRIIDKVAELIHSEYDGFPGLKKVVIHGAARGADWLAGEEAKKLDFEVREYPADWSVGHAGGIIRNQIMLEDGRLISSSPSTPTSRSRREPRTWSVVLMRRAYLWR